MKTTNWDRLLKHLLMGAPLEELPEVFKRMGRYLQEAKENPIHKEMLLSFLLEEEKRTRSVALVLLSDWHVGNQGYGSMENFEKIYNTFRRRLKSLLSRYHYRFPFFDIVVAILGDMMEYEMRKENILGEWNDMDIIQKVQYTQKKLEGIIEDVEEVMGYSPKVAVLWGNHSRLQKEYVMAPQDTLEHVLGLNLSQKYNVIFPNKQDYIALNILGRTVILEHGDGKYSMSLGRPSLNSIKQRFLYFDEVEKDVDVIITGHFHAKTLYDVNQRTFMVAPALIPTTHYGSRKGYYRQPKQSVVVLTNKENRLRVSPIFDVWGC